MKKFDSIVGFVTGPSVSVWFMHSVFTLFKQDASERFGASWLMTMGPYIHQNRNELQLHMLKTDRDWMLMIDNDIVFEPEDVSKLFEVADEKGPGVYLGPYVVEDGTMVCGSWAPDQPTVYARISHLPAEPCRVGMVGMGFTLIHREVFERLGLGAFTALSPTHGEDVSFCWRCRDAEIPIWIQPSAKPGHAKQVVVYPDESVRNIIGDQINLFEMPPVEVQAMITNGDIEGGET